MPIYSYQCHKCEAIKDEYRKIDERNILPLCCGEEMQRKIVATMVSPDIQSYRTIACDKETGRKVTIDSRKQHREFLKRNDLIEVG